ncbi:uncharacterized protein RJT20DRAFT_124835 [Scheffersomyces xylosifermentans]|uniref:uncharacterized protein n=1 Tax=Scheffersomyces xylosifermentans TaxID=1304137 RepID=UPI00315DD316
MSTHPYRQKVPSASTESPPANSAPYPLDTEFPRFSSGSATTLTAATQPSQSSSSLGKFNESTGNLGSDTPTIADSSNSGSSTQEISSSKQSSSTSNGGGSSGYQTPLDESLQYSNHSSAVASLQQTPTNNNTHNTNLHHHNTNSISSNNNKSTANNSGVRSPTISSTPYPVYDASTPPPVFASKESVTVISPSSNPLSATSSVTNFNLNQQSGLDSQVFSKSENNLTTPGQFSKFGHNRSVSSSSSFFYDKDNASMVDFSQNVIQQYLGSNSTHLLPRIKTIELYRKNARKSNDPTVLFQYAQYMLQTALLLDAEPNVGAGTGSGSSNGSQGSQGSNSNSNVNTPSQSSENSPRRGPLDREHSGSSLNIIKSHKKSASLDFSSSEFTDGSPIDDKKLKKALLKEAVHYLKRLSDKGYVDAQYLLGDAYSSGALDKVENREAFALFQSAAKHGHVESAYRTSYCYEEGLGTGRDARKAIEYLKMAASKNHPAAMYKLGVYSFYGRMGLSNHINTKKMGIKWLTRASNVANELIAAAPFELGKIYYNGFQDIVIVDKKYALELYSQAAALGHIQSAALLGQFYEVGEIVPQDNNLSIHYYTQAALGGDAESMLAMCAWYLIGSDPYLPKDEGEAFEWAKRAALCNLPKAQFALANFYDKGIGCIKDEKEAQIWYKKAAENGEEKSITRITDKAAAGSLQKKLLKRKSSSTLTGHESGQGTKVSNAAQDKDCVIM